MTDNELTIWEHLDSVIRVLTSKEMGAWLYRRDKRVLDGELEKIKAEIECNMRKNNCDLYGYADSLVIIDKHIAELKGDKE
jgi:hypothetical protein